MNLLEKFPKKREPLPEVYQKIYIEFHKRNRQGTSAATSLSRRMERWMHRRVAADRKKEFADSLDTLEIGAGTLNQLEYELPGGIYDIVEPFRELYENSPHLHRIQTIYPDMADVPVENSYDRITTVAAFEHILNLPEVMARTVLHLKPGGSLRVAIPSEGTPLWKLGWKLSTGLEFRWEYGLDYGVIMRYEHVNSASEIEEVLRFFYGNVVCRVFGICRFLSLYRFYECRSPDKRKAKEFLSNILTTSPKLDAGE